MRYSKKKGNRHSALSDNLHVSIGKELGADPEVILQTSHGRRSIDILKLISPEKANWECTFVLCYCCCVLFSPPYPTLSDGKVIPLSYNCVILVFELSAFLVFSMLHSSNTIALVTILKIGGVKSEFPASMWDFCGLALGWLRGLC